MVIILFHYKRSNSEELLRLFLALYLHRHIIVISALTVTGSVHISGELVAVAAAVAVQVEAARAPLLSGLRSLLLGFLEFSPQNDKTGIALLF